LQNSSVCPKSIANMAVEQISFAIPPFCEN